MVEVIIIINESGAMTTEIKGASPENPACSLIQKLNDADKAVETLVKDIKMEERHHEH